MSTPDLMCVVLVFKSANFPSTSTRQSDTGLSGLIASKNDGQFLPLQEFSVILVIYTEIQ